MSEPTDSRPPSSAGATCDPWRLITETIHLLAREGIKTTFSRADRIGDADELEAACALLRSLGVEPVVPPWLCDSCEDGEHRCEGGCGCDCDRARLIRGEL